MRVYDFICAAAGILGSGIASLFGGWDTALVTLVWFMGIDYVTGMLVAGVFHKSPKTPGGGLESRADALLGGHAVRLLRAVSVPG